MLEPRLHELLSAHLDDEVPSAERAEVEALLEHDAEARGEFDDLAEVSGMLRDLVPLNAPHDLRSSVLHAIGASKRGTLADVAAPTRTAAVRVAVEPARRGRLGTIVALAATLACTFLVVAFLGPETPPTAVDVAESVRAPRNEPAVARAPQPSDDFARDSHHADALRKLREPGAPTDLALNETQREFGEGQARYAVRDRFGGVRKESDDGPRTFLLKQADLDENRGYVDPLDPAEAPREVLEALAPGDVVPFLDRTGGRVAVVEVTVIDVRRAYGEVQLLLQRHAIEELRDRERSTGSESAAIERRAAALGDTADADEPQRSVGDVGAFAVYVTTTPAQLTATLSDLRKSALVLGVQTPTPPAGETLAAVLRDEVERDGKDARFDRGAGQGAPTNAARSRTPDGEPGMAFRGARTAAAGPSPTEDAAKPLDGPASVSGPRTEAEADRFEQNQTARMPVENSYQLLGRAGSAEIRENRAREPRADDRTNTKPDLLAESLHPEALRPAAADAIRAHRIDDASVRVLILLRPAPK
jgi:hypothetical protein